MRFFLIATFIRVIIVSVYCYFGVNRCCDDGETRKRAQLRKTKVLVSLLQCERRCIERYDRFEACANYCYLQFMFNWVSPAGCQLEEPIPHSHKIKQCISVESQSNCENKLDGLSLPAYLNQFQCRQLPYLVQQEMNTAPISTWILSSRLDLFKYTTILLISQIICDVFNVDQLSLNDSCVNRNPVGVSICREISDTCMQM